MKYYSLPSHEGLIVTWRKKTFFGRRMPEAFIAAVLLSLSGGLQDVYIYLAWGRVFANAQTGSITLLSINLMERNWPIVLGYLVPLVFFALGVAISELIYTQHKEDRRVHWRQRVLVVEMILLFIMGSLPVELNLLANALVSFSCAMQVQTSRKIKGASCTSTMCIGNLRDGMETLYHFVLRDKPRERVLTWRYLTVIFSFALGAAPGSSLTPYFGMKTIWTSCLLLSLSFSLMFFQGQEERKERNRINPS